ncbi:MAG: hypothetical protein SFV15_22660 [Polyangiaceae bacterium]|nr:hypothetical protein [Polyangiaceae bacterium]
MSNKPDQVHIARLKGITEGTSPGSLLENRLVGRWVQNSVLDTISLRENGRQFQSAERTAATSGARNAVQPDGVADQTLWKSEDSIAQGLRNIAGFLFGAFPNEVRKDSTLYEVKSLKQGSTIHLSDSKHQIRGLIDVASKQEAARTTSGLPPVLRFVTTGGVQIGADVIAEASKRGVLIVHHTIEEVLDTDTHESRVRIGAGHVLNPGVLSRRNVELPIGAPSRAGKWHDHAPESHRMDD